MTPRTPCSPTATGSARPSTVSRRTSSSAIRCTVPSCSSATRRRLRTRTPTVASRPPRADGQLTANASLTPLVQVADCLPVALVGAGGVAMLHCGWRGLAAGIVARGVDRRRAHARPRSVRGSAAVATRSGTRSLGAFEPLGDGIADGRMLDLAEVARRLLARAGVEQVEVGGPVHELRARALLLAPARSRKDRPAGGPRVAGRRCLSRSTGSSPRSCARNLARVRERCGPRVEILAATKYVGRRRDGGACRGGCDAGRREPPSGPRGEARALRRTPSRGTSSATCRAAR